MRTAIKLDPEASRKVIDAAMQTQAQVILDSQVFANTTINGYLISGDGSTLVIEVTGFISIPKERLLNAHCSAQLFADQHYRFETVIQAVPSWGDNRTIAITRPNAIGVTERRRFVRAKLAPSSRVHLQWTVSGREHSYVGMLLNISADGMACKVPNLTQDMLARDDVIRVKFSMPGISTPFDLRAAVMNKTPASEGSLILGLHFEREPAAAEQLSALELALHHPENMKHATEAFV